MRYLSILCAFLLFLVSCGDGQRSGEPVNGIWRGTIALNDSVNLPFNFEWKKNDTSYSMIILNGGERIEATEVTEKGDSLIIRLPVFASYFKVKKGAERMDGYFVKPDAEDYRLLFNAMAHDSSRFKAGEKNCCDINKKWAVKFSPGTEDEAPAIGYFEQSGTNVTGTFMTETGDYRYLQGTLSGAELRLSAFDGSNLVLFKATIDDGQKMHGYYFSGRSWAEPWIAYRDDNFELRDADALTYLKEGYETLDFSFPDTRGNMVSLNDEEYRDKPVVVQIMGSWCPNCMDESRYLKQVYEEYHDAGLEIVALAFERVKDKETAIARVEKMKKDLDLPYPVLIAGSTREDKPEEALPALNHVMSFPTAIYLNRDHRVEKIHTGFSGPGTPVYDQYITENNAMIEKLLYSGETEAKKNKNL